MNTVKVMLAFANMLFSEGIRRILEGDKDIAISEVLESGSECHVDRLVSLNPDVILTDFTTLYNTFPGIENSSRKFHFILLDTNCGRENLVTAILKKKISGVLLSNATPTLLKKSIRSVSKGEVWIDKQTFKDLLSGINAIDRDKTATLSDREKELVVLIGQGLRNKEIAQKLNISEPTVKSHLTRIFQKLNVKTRSELIGYAIKNNDMTGFFASPGKIKPSDS